MNVEVAFLSRMYYSINGVLNEELYYHATTQINATHKWAVGLAAPRVPESKGIYNTTQQVKLVHNRMTRSPSLNISRMPTLP